MKKAISYARISAQGQVDNYSITTQLEAIHKYATENDMEIIKDFTDCPDTGSELDRLALTEVREFVKSGQAQAIIVFDPDRLARNFVHLMVLANEFEQLGVELHFVTQPVGKTPEEKMLFGMKGLFAEYERTKILERTARGIKQRAKSGKFPSGRRARLYGYSYIPSEGVRKISETEAVVVRDIFKWLVEEELTLNAITYRLRALGVPTPSGNGYWNRSTVYRILTHPGYIGRSYCFTQVHKETDRHYKKSRKSRKTSIQTKPTSEWLELPNVTPAIISEDLFNQVQARLAQNQSQANRNGKVKYLLRGHIYCSRCGRKYWGYARWHNGQPTTDRRYYCMGRRSIVTPHKCDNKGYEATPLEDAVWKEVEAVLCNPDLVLEGIKTRQAKLGRDNLLEKELDTASNQLANREKQKDRAHQAFLLTGDLSRFNTDMSRLDRETEALEQRKAEIESRISANKQFDLNVSEIKEACGLVKNNLKTLSFEEKRLALSALQIQVYIDGENVSLHGVIPMGNKASTPAG